MERLAVSDDELIYMIKEGNEEAAGLLFFRYEIITRSLIRKNKTLLNNAGYDDNDILSVARQILREAIESYNLRLSAFFPFYRELFYKKIFNVIRSSLNRLSMFDYSYELNEDLIMYGGEGELADSSKEMENHLLLEDIYKTVSEMDEKLIQIFYLWLGGFTYNEIGKIMNLPTKTIANRLAKILKIIRQKMVSAYR